MPVAPIPTGRRRRHLAVVAVAVGLAAAAHSDAGAQEVAALVNGEPITSLDIANRIKLTQISTHKIPPRKEVLDELIDEKLKLHVAKRYVLDVKDKEVDGAFNGMARRAGSTPKQFADALTQAGISVEALKQRIKADIGWQAIIRGKFQGQLQVGEKDVLTALASRKKDDKPDLSYDYTLRQVMFIVPRGSPPSAAEARLHEAEALRARFQSCDEGLPMARALRDVAVREPMRRSSADLPAQQRQILDGTAAGRLTPPEITLQGVETFAVCSKAQAGGDDTPGRREVREEITTERYNAQAKRFLRELRRGAMIELR